MVLADTLALAARTQAAPDARLRHADRRLRVCAHRAHSGVFTNRAGAGIAAAAGRAPPAASASGRFRCDEDFDTDLESKVADIEQCAVDGKGDHILAARFLRASCPTGMPWVHVDLASATRSGGLAHVAHRHHRLRRALRAGAAAAAGALRAAPGPARMSAALRLRRPDDWHLHLRDGAALRAVLPLHRRALRARDRDAEPAAAGDHHRHGARLPRAHPGRAARRAARFEPLMTLYLTDTHRAGGDRARARQRRRLRLQALPGRRHHPLGCRRHRHAPHRRGARAHGERRPAAAGARRGHATRRWTSSTARRASSTACWRRCVAAPCRACAWCSSTSPRAPPCEFVRGARARRRRHDHAAAPAAQPQRAVRRRHPPAPLLPAGAQARGATGAALLDAVARRRSALLPRHRQRAARAPRQGSMPAAAPASSPRMPASSCMPRSSSRPARCRGSRTSPPAFGARLLPPAAQRRPHHAAARAVDAAGQLSLRRRRAGAAARRRADRAGGCAP